MQELHADLHWSATALKPLTGEVNYIDHLIRMQRSAGKPWIPAFVPIDQSTLPHDSSILWRHCHLPHLLGQYPQPHHKKHSGMGPRTRRRAQCANLAPKLPRSQSEWVRSMDTVPRNPQDPNNSTYVLVPDTTGDTHRAWEGSAQHWAGSFHAVADRCTFKPTLVK